MFEQLIFSGHLKKFVYTILCASLCLLSACQKHSDNQPQNTTKSEHATAINTAHDSNTFIGIDISAEKIGADFSLNSTLGKKISLKDTQGKIVVMLFGFTHCPDVCPTNLMTYSQALKMLGDKAENVQLYFVTVDPERDTPELLGKYVPFFHPSFVGLIPETQTELEKLAQEWKITYKKVPLSRGNYTMDHSAGSYILDKTGKTVLYEAHGISAYELAQDLELLIDKK